MDIQLNRALFAATLLALSVAPAEAQKTKAQLNTEVSTNFPDNTTGAITPSILRATVNDMIASWQQYGGVSAQITSTYTIQLSDYGQLVTVNNASPIAVTLPQATGSFQYFSFWLKNTGASTATITPITSTINGGANLVVATGTSVYVVSDGTNWTAVVFGVPSTGNLLPTNNTWTGTNLFAPTSGDAITATPAANSTFRALSTTQSGPTSGITTATSGTNCVLNQPFLAYNYGCIDLDGANVSSGAATFGWTWGMNSGGANSAGTKITGQFINLHQNASNPAALRDSIALNASSTSIASDGGTGLTTGTAKGTNFGMGIGATLGGSAANYLENAGFEADCGITGTATSVYHFCGSFVNAGGIHAAVQEGAVAIGASGAGSGGWNTGLLFTSANGASPINSGGTAIGTSNNAVSVSNLIDFNAWTCSNYIFRGPGTKFAVDCNANIIGATVTTGSTGGSNGVVAFNGATSGAGSMQAQSVMGTPIWTLPTNSGTVVVSATAPLAVNTTTGNISLTGYNGGAWTVYTATASPGSGTITTQSSDASYVQIGKIVFVEVHVTISNIGTGTGGVRISLPPGVSCKHSGSFIPGRENGVSGKMISGVCNSPTSWGLVNYDNTAVTFSNGVVYDLVGSFEAL